MAKMVSKTPHNATKDSSDDSCKTKSSKEMHIIILSTIKTTSNQNVIIERRLQIGKTRSLSLTTQLLLQTLLICVTTIQLHQLLMILLT